MNVAREECDEQTQHNLSDYEYRQTDAGTGCSECSSAINAMPRTQDGRRTKVTSVEANFLLAYPYSATFLYSNCCNLRAILNFSSCLPCASSCCGTSTSRFIRTWSPENIACRGCGCTRSRTTTAWSSCSTSFPTSIRTSILCPR